MTLVDIGMKERAAQWLADVSYRDWVFHLGQDSSGRLWLQVQFEACGKGWHGRKWLLSAAMTKSEVVQTALMAVLAAEEHEARERFRYQGRVIFGPHFNIDKLVAVCDDGDALAKRTPPPSLLVGPLLAVLP